jgi:hypothetical protein
MINLQLIVKDGVYYMTNAECGGHTHMHKHNQKRIDLYLT